MTIWIHTAVVRLILIYGCLAYREVLGKKRRSMILRITNWIHSSDQTYFEIRMSSIMGSVRKYVGAGIQDNKDLHSSQTDVI